MSGDSRFNYLPGADHLPRGDDRAYREGWDRIYGTPDRKEDTPEEIIKDLLDERLNPQEDE